ncbi:MAG: nucleotidyl transferase AbiEii/AbiGii toxin family protein [Thermodesulfobacteriota bacterium]|nr:nucleotidyl transferase AbiEii/AbiGii toxin family protein [Thermodesulfobacteriota bacterium]
MDIFKKHEIFEIEVLETLKNSKLLEPLVFGGGTMLRLCFEIKRYSADLDFWFVKKVDINSYFEKIKKVLEQKYDLTDEQVKFYTLLLEIRSGDYPKRLKIEIRKEVAECDFQERIAFSKYSNRQVILRVHTLEQAMINKVNSLLERGEIRDGFDIEFLLRKGIAIPQLNKEQKNNLKKRIDGFKEKDFKVKLGSILESDMRKYYIENRFSYLKEKLNGNSGYLG